MCLSKGTGAFSVHLKNQFLFGLIKSFNLNDRLTRSLVEFLKQIPELVTNQRPR